VEPALEAAAEKVSERAPAAYAVEQVGGGSYALGAQVHRHGRPRVVRPVRVPAGPQHGRRGGVLERGGVYEPLRLARASPVGEKALHPAESADAQPTAPLVAKGRERARGKAGDPGVEPVAGQPQGLAQTQLELLRGAAGKRGEGRGVGGSMACRYVVHHRLDQLAQKRLFRQLSARQLDLRLTAPGSSHRTLRFGGVKTRQPGTHVHQVAGRVGAGARDERPSEELVHVGSRVAGEEDLRVRRH
jgi:hypothetical protein